MPQGKPDKVAKLRIISLAFELGYIIAIPIVVFLLGGKYLDEKFGASPWFKIAGLILAIATTTMWLARRFSEIFKATYSPRPTESPPPRADKPGEEQGAKNPVRLRRRGHGWPTPP